MQPNPRSYSVMKVKSRWIPQCKSSMEQWVVLSQALPADEETKWATKPERLSLIRHADGLVVTTQNCKILVELNLESYTISSPHIFVLLHYLKELMLAVGSSKSVTCEQQSLAEKWLPIITYASHQANDLKLAYLFEYGTGQQPFT